MLVLVRIGFAGVLRLALDCVAEPVPAGVLEFTGENHLWHSKFVGVREDKKAKDVVRE